MPRSTDRRAMLGCFPAVGAGRRPPRSPPSGLLNLTYDDGSTSTSVSVSPPSSASTSSPAFLDEVDPDDADAQADLSSAIASRRLSLAPPGRSNSIVDSSSPEHAAAPCHGGTCSVPGPMIPSQSVDGAEAVRSVTLSTDAPRAEFLKSMLEMAEALGLDPRRGADRARMHDLLLWYIAINDSDTLRDILGAFTELLCILNGNTTGDGTGTTPPATATADRATHR